MRNQERSPNWYGTALEARRAFGLCGFESRPLRHLQCGMRNAKCGVPNAEFNDALPEIPHSAFRTPHLYQAPASVQSRPHETRQDRKVATVVSFECAAAVTGA